MDNTRKASEILLALETKVEQLINMVHAHDLNNRIISNKLNMILEQMKNSSQEKVIQSFLKENPYTISSTDGKMPDLLLASRLNTPQQQVIKVSTDKLPLLEVPHSLRRNSRTEVPVEKQQITSPSFNKKIGFEDPAPPDMSQFKSKLPQQTVTTPTTPLPIEADESVEQDFQAFPNPLLSPNLNNKVAVIQRVVEKNNKSVFLADVEVLDEANNLIFKTRTNGVGKWQASLPVGIYKVRLSKRESVTKQKIEKYQNISVDGKLSQVNLEPLIID